MNGGRSDASTSTEDILKGRPLCLFYFTHPFGVLSPEPPVLSAAPPYVTRTFLNMQPVSPHWSSSSQDYRSDPSSRPSPSAGGMLHLRGDSLSSLFSSEMWFSSDSCERRVVPYHKLPPLQLPAPPTLSPVWPRESLEWPRTERISLPPIDLPFGAVTDCGWQTGEQGVGQGGGRRRPRLNSVRRQLTGLMRRNVKGKKYKKLLSLRPSTGCQSDGLLHKIDISGNSEELQQLMPTSLFYNRTTRRQLGFHPM